MKIFITGGSGNLGKELKKIIPNTYQVCSPTKTECDILVPSILKYYIEDYNPDIILHLAAFVDTVGCEENKEKAIDTNIIGTTNLVKSCLDIKCKFVYVSSEYVFKGDKGNYSVNDKQNPINVYGKTKSASEYIVSILSNYQIIRAPFIKTKYPEVYTNQYCSRYFIEDVAARIFDNIINNNDKIIHIANEKKSLYNHYLDKGLSPCPIEIPKNMEHITPKDTSLINNSI